MADEFPAARLQRLAAVVEDAIEDHERRLHVPKRNRARLEAIPFPTRKLTDVQTAKAREMLEMGSTIEEIVLALDAPVSVIERALAEFKPRWRRYLQELETAD